ncbi:NADPH:quinone reductase [Streptomyces sp. CB02923]|uniref:quinone oxidoreductase family protein n=1 Tax=Streptomyces sp. CB02923 TaxID=1718985 RepID=UPI000939D3C6|nr:zinc-binding dehydrogenase [Streptomyces sp. CB02923]OKI00792.1 NADPH:quinone reductase [Streptomyces sp. CB02923]
MRRVRFHTYGGPEVLRIEEAEAPAPGPGELLVRTEAIGVSLPSVRRTRGDGKGGGVPLPAVLGGEVAGEVTGLGPDVTGFAVGDRVTSISFTGSYAEAATVPAALAARIPDAATGVDAVALVRGGQVALAALATAAPTGPESVLITGAASATGHLAVQLAKLRGVPRVVAAVGSAAKADFLYGLGADEVVTYDDETWGAPADIVLDGVGGDLLPRAVAALVPGGRLVFFNSGGGTVPAHALLAGSKTITGLTMARFAATRPELYERHGTELWDHFFAGRLRAAVHAQVPLAEAARAHEIIEARANLGKVVLLP